MELNGPAITPVRFFLPGISGPPGRRNARRNHRPVAPPLL